MRIDRSVRITAFAMLAGLCLLGSYVAVGAQQGGPRYRVDADWPKRPLPNKWFMSGVTGLDVDKDQPPAKDAAGVAAYRVKYPPTTPLIVAGLEEIRADEDRRELYAIDSYLGGRVFVYDMDTGEVQAGERVQRFVPVN